MTPEREAEIRRVLSIYTPLNVGEELGPGTLFNIAEDLLRALDDVRATMTTERKAHTKLVGAHIEAEKRAEHAEAGRDALRVRLADYEQIVQKEITGLRDQLTEAQRAQDEANTRAFTSERFRSEDAADHVDEQIQYAATLKDLRGRLAAAEGRIARVLNLINERYGADWTTNDTVTGGELRAALQSDAETK